MPQADREIVLIPFQTISGSGTSGDFIVPGDYTQAIFKLNVGVVTGTSPTLDLYIQQRVGTAASTDKFMGRPTGTPVYDDFIHFSQVTATVTQFCRWCAYSGPASPNASSMSTQVTAPSDAALSAGTVRLSALGFAWRFKWVVGGTTPVFPGVNLVGQFFNY